MLEPGVGSAGRRSDGELLKACVTGDHIKEGTLTVRKAGGKAPVEYLKIKINRT